MQCWVGDRKGCLSPTIQSTLLCTRIGFSDVGGTFLFGHGFVAAASSNIETTCGPKTALQPGEMRSWTKNSVAEADPLPPSWIKMIPPWGVCIVRMRPFYLMSGKLVFLWYSKNFPWTTQFLEDCTDETSVTLSSIFGSSWKNLGQMWTEKWFRLTEASGPESPSSNSVFYLSSAAGIRRACVWMGRCYCEMLPAQVMSLWWLVRTSVAT